MSVRGTLTGMSVRGTLTGMFVTRLTLIGMLYANP